ncbi:MAG: hypothetical protein F6K19_47925, partial [Cyanothece sp. SIO1E1]|nr:hypothetical protein [Cyanothece sp. SIO1E1]
MENVEDIYALTPLQKGILFHALYSPQSGVYFEQLSCRIKEPLQVNLFKQAWDQVYRQHAALRSLFLWEEIEEPVQVVRGEVVIPWTEEDWRGETAIDQRLTEYLENDRRVGFDLGRAPICRMLLARESDTSWRFVWSYHHILLDGWSYPIVIREVKETYNSLLEGRDGEAMGLGDDDVPLFRDYVIWQSEQELDRAQAFWKQSLEGFEAPIELEAMAESADRGHQTLEHLLEADLSAAIAAYARENRVTLNTVIHGAWALLLKYYTGQNDLVFGSTVANRPPEIAGVERLVGCCINTLPFRVTMDDEQPLSDWFTGMQSTHLGMRDYSYVGLNSIRNWAGFSGERQLFDTIIVFENYPVVGGEEEGLQLTDVELLEQSNFPLALLVIPEAQGMKLFLIVDSEKYPVAVARRMLDHFQAILSSFVDPKVVTVGDVRLLGAQERSQLNALSYCRGPEQVADS